MLNPKISIILPNYNSYQFISETLKSVINQSYKNWELILIDDNSNKNTREILNNYIKEKNIKIIFLKKNMGTAFCRNYALRLSSSEYVAFIDSDDIWQIDKLEKQVALFKKNESIGLVYSNCYLFYENSKKKKIFKNKTLKTGHVTDYLFKGHNIGILTILISRKAYKSVSGFNDEYSIIGDFDLIVRLSLKWEFDCVQEPLAYYRIHNKNFSSLNSSLEIKEFENWLLNKEIKLNKNLQPHLYYIREKIVFLKTIKNINEGRLKQALKSILFFPIGFSKFKLFIYIFLPKKLINR